MISESGYSIDLNDFEIESEESKAKELKGRTEDSLQLNTEDYQ